MTSFEALIHEFYKRFVDKNHIASNGKYHPTAFLTMRAAIPDEIERFIVKAYEAGKQEAYEEVKQWFNTMKVKSVNEEDNEKGKLLQLLYDIVLKEHIVSNLEELMGK